MSGLDLDRLTPVIPLICAVPDGKGRPHGKNIDSAGLYDGKVVGPSGRLLENGLKWVVTGCPKHGALVVLESDVLAAIERRQKPLEVSRRFPQMRQMRRKR